MKAIVLLIASVCVRAYSAETHREHKAHQHGSARIEMAFQGPNGQIDIEAPSEGLYGFEYVPKTEGDKKKQHDALALLETNIAEIIQFEAALKCEISKIKIEVDQHEGEKHADVDASFKVVCQTSPLDSSVVFNFQKSFPGLKTVKVEVLADDVQKSLTVKKAGEKLALKKR